LILVTFGGIVGVFT